MSRSDDKQLQGNLLGKPRDANAFLHENEHKCHLVKLCFNWLIDSRRKTLNTLRTSLYLSTEGCCQRLSESDVSFMDSLMSTHEEADLRLMVHVKHAINSNSLVNIRSHSGHTDIFIMALKFYSANLILHWCRKNDSVNFRC